MLLVKTLRSSTFKLALVAIAIFGVIVLVLFSYVYLSTVNYVSAQADRAITDELHLLQNAYQQEGLGGLTARIQRNISDGQRKDIVYLVTDPSFAFIAGNIKEWPRNLRNSNGSNEFRGPDQDTTIRAMLQTLPDGNHLLVGKSVSGFDGFLQEMVVAFLATIALILALAGIASVMVSRRTVGRIESINATSRAILESGLGKRIPLRGTHDEWDQVAENLNVMLSRIETLLDDLRQATDNVAHDLRTPLTRMRGRLEKAYHCPRNDDADQDLIGESIGDLDVVLGIFSSLTRISQIESVRRSTFRSVDLTDVAVNVVELYDAAAEEGGVRLSLIADRRVIVTGDRDLLFDAVANLVDNAIKHGRRKGQVIVEIADADDGGALISVADDGPGIPAQEHHNVLKRFYRLERSRSTPGSGLGLSLVDAVARLHGARVEMQNNDPGLIVRLLFSKSENAQIDTALPAS